MDVRELILATLAASTAGSGCYWGCGREQTEDIAVDGELSHQELVTIAEEEDLEGIDQITCELACQYAATHGGGSSYLGYDERWDLENCAYEPEPADEYGHVSATIQCDGEVTYNVLCEGRRPLGHVEAAGPMRDLGERFAHIAHLEAASVVAFLQLVRQLRALGAPEQLVERCRQAAAEEVVHARLFGALARRCGASTPEVRQEPSPEDLLTIALHNATEGCVGETWAALQARWQAHHSPDPLLRSIFLRVAADETGHAQLAWDLHAWLLTRLDPAEQALVRRAQREALADLPALALRQSEASPRVLGLPSPAFAASLAARFAAGLAA